MQSAVLRPTEENTQPINSAVYELETSSRSAANKSALYSSLTHAVVVVLISTGGLVGRLSSMLNFFSNSAQLVCSYVVDHKPVDST